MKWSFGSLFCFDQGKEVSNSLLKGCPNIRAIRKNLHLDQKKDRLSAVYLHITFYPAERYNLRSLFSPCQL